MDLQAEIELTRRELASIEGAIAKKELERDALVPGPGYGDAKARLDEHIRQLTKTSARLQRELRTLTASLNQSLQPKLL